MALPAVTLTFPPIDAEQAAVLGWGAAVRRDLPWRHTRDPWAILVAEVMAQQTQVDRVVPKWQAFLRRWPDAASLAGAALAEVLDEWAGLGYPRRARNLRDAAQRIAQEHGGEVPRDLRSLLDLPGIGPYTARAVMAFAHELDAAVVDTNVGRILARRAGRQLTPSVAQAAADEWLPPGQAWAWNQTMLDLGALLCRPVEPGCDECPARPGCIWARAGRPEPDPARGSAGVSRRQARFEGSARQARGLLLDAARSGPVPPERWAQVIGWTDRASDADAARADAVRADAVREVVDSLLGDGLCELDEQGQLVLPRS